MSGIGSEHNKFNSCQGCPERKADPNCHESCQGYIFRQKEKEWKKEEERKRNVPLLYRQERITERKIKELKDKKHGKR